MQAQRGSHILRMSTFPDLIHCPDPQRLKGLMIEFPAVVIPHDTILPDHKIKVELLMNYLVFDEIPVLRGDAERRALRSDTSQVVGNFGEAVGTVRLPDDKLDFRSAGRSASLAP